MQPTNNYIQKYLNKAYANYAFVKCMSGSFKEALELCEKVDVESLTFTDRIKHEIKNVFNLI